MRFLTFLWCFIVFLTSVTAVPGYHSFFHPGQPQSSPNFGPPGFRHSRPNRPFTHRPSVHNGGSGYGGGGYGGAPPGPGGYGRPKPAYGTGPPPKKLALRHGVRLNGRCYPDEQSYCCSKHRGYGAVTIYNCMPTRKGQSCLYGERYGYCCEVGDGKKGKKHAPYVTATCSDDKGVCEIENATRCHHPLPPTQSG